MKKLFYFSLVAALTACAGKYKIPESADTAKIQFIHAVANSESTTTIKVFDNEECAQNDNSAQLTKIGHHYTTKQRKANLPVVAGKKIFLASHLWKQVGNENQGFRNKNCSNLISFIPEKDKQYQFKAKFTNNNRCEVEIIDTESQLPPLDLNTHKALEACQKSGKFDYFDM